MIQFKLFGIKVKISFLYIALITGLSIYDKSGILFIGVLSALAHEMCHLIAIFFTGGKPNLISFEIFGIKIKQNKLLSGLKQTIVLLAGCFGNILLFIIALKMNFLNLATVNLCLCVFNMLPSKSLDGGQLLLLGLEKALNQTSVYIVYKLISILVSIAIISVGLLLFIKYKNPTLILTGVFLAITSFLDPYL